MNCPQMLVNSQLTEGLSQRTALQGVYRVMNSSPLIIIHAITMNIIAALLFSKPTPPIASMLLLVAFLSGVSANDAEHGHQNLLRRVHPRVDAAAVPSTRRTSSVPTLRLQDIEAAGSENSRRLKKDELIALQRKLGPPESVP